MAAQKPRLLYWLVTQPSSSFEQRAAALKAYHIQVEFYANAETLLQALEVRRPNIVIFSDSMHEDQACEELQKLAASPQANGVRFILSLERNVPKLQEMAVSCNFRDIIPIHTDEAYWLQRLLYASASKPSHFPLPATQVSLNHHLATVNFPGRLVWLSENRIRLEVAASPAKGAVLHLLGPIAETFGVQQLTLTVEEKHKTNLRYRFSEALVCTWNPSEQSTQKIQSMLSEQSLTTAGNFCRTYVAAKSPDLRKQLLKYLPESNFEIKFALQLHAITTEPQFFGPDLVIIEDEITSGQHAERFAALLSNISPKAPVIIVNATQNTATLRAVFNRDNIYAIKKIPQNLANLIFTELKVGIQKDVQSGRHFMIRPENQLAKVLVNFSARLTMVHPNAAQLALPFEAGRFSMFQLSSPLVRKMTGINPWIKATNVGLNYGVDATAFPFLVDGFFADLDNFTKPKMVEALASHMLTYLRQGQKELLVARDRERDSEDLPEIQFAQAAVALEVKPQSKGPTPITKVAAKVSEINVEDLTGVLNKSLSSAFAKQLYLVSFVVLLLFVLMYFLFVNHSSQQDKSSQWFNDQLYKFAPDQFEKNNKKGNSNKN